MGKVTRLQDLDLIIVTTLRGTIAGVTTILIATETKEQTEK